MSNWWDGLHIVDRKPEPVSERRHWWEGLPTTPIKSVETSNSSSVRLTHSDLDGASILLIRVGAMWRIDACTFPNGRQSDPVRELSIRNLMIDSLYSDNPKIIYAGGRNKAEPELCLRCFSDNIKVSRYAGKYHCICMERDCANRWTE